MKRNVLSFIITMLMFANVSAQNVARECVLFEVFTGVNCPYCPAAALAIGQLLEEGKSVAPVAYHTNAFSIPQLYTDETNARAYYYYIQAYPTVKVDGVLNPGVGGGASNQEYIDYSYNQCLSAYNQRVNVTSPYAIDLSFEYASGTECKVVVTANKVGECNSDDVRLFVVLTESHIQRNWQGMSEVNFVTRDMIPNQNGTQLTSDSQTMETTIDLAGFDRSNIELVAWVQSYTGNKEVYQAVKFPLSSMSFENDVEVENVEEVVLGSCSGIMSPRVSFKNEGTETMTTATFNVKDENGNILSTSQWEGSLNSGEVSEYIIPEFKFDADSNIIIEITDVNSNNDGYPIDNIYVIEAVEPVHVSDGYMKLQLRTGDDPENFSIEIKNMDDNEIVKTFTYDKPKTIYQEDIYLPKVGCYRVTMRNTAGNGFNGGFWGVKNSSNENLITGSNTENEFRYEFAFEISCDGVGVDEVVIDNVMIYPNPATSFINVSANNISNVKVYNVSGQMVFSQEVSSDMIEINTESWANGMYYINIETSEGYVVSEKVIVNK